MKTIEKHKKWVKMQEKRPDNEYQVCSYRLAGATGIEPALTVLETGVLPLYDAPVCLININY